MLKEREGKRKEDNSKEERMEEFSKDRLRLIYLGHEWRLFSWPSSQGWVSHRPWCSTAVASSAEAVPACSALKWAAADGPGSAWTRAGEACSSPCLPPPLSPCCSRQSRKTFAKQDKQTDQHFALSTVWYQQAVCRMDWRENLPPFEGASAETAGQGAEWRDTSSSACFPLPFQPF